jgi:crotonobetainyl-CoA:carnitine CoA-transferase CaiB-like acyl-CoA transferase
MRKVLGIFGEEHSDDPEYDTYDPANQAKAEEWKRVIRGKFLERTVEEWVRAFDKAGVPVSPVHFPEEMADDPQVIADGMVHELEHTVTGSQRVVAPLVLMSKTPTGPQRAAPAMGEHSAEVLIEHGYTPEEVAELVTSEVIMQR